MNDRITRRKFLRGFAAVTMSLRAMGRLDARASGQDEVVLRFLENYANILHATYSDTFVQTEQLKRSIKQFIEAPTEAGLQQAREKWIAARKSYLQSEAARFYDGPIDELEGFINAWPIDENYIDYTESEPQAGIINQTTLYPTISKQLLVSLNEKEGEKSISTGWHAIEFLLWGQDLSEVGPGNRSYKDYTDPKDGGHPNALRRWAYLDITIELLCEQILAVAVQWEPLKKDNYRARFLAALPHESLEKVIRGMGSFSGAELGGERTVVAYTTKEQEDEHSCFSDMTHQDMRYDQIGIMNVCRGIYHQLDGKTIQGDGLLAVIRTKNAAMATQLDEQLRLTLKAIESVPIPFDQAIKGKDTAPGRMALKRVIDALQAQTKTMAVAAKELGIQLNLK
jgi:putative iron-regulated protein